MDGPNLAPALAYAARGWRVYRIHTIEGGKCSCLKDCGKDAGKHPVDKGGRNSATADQARVRDLFRKSTANVGIATGEASGLLVLDVDPRNGGDASLAQLLAKHGPLPRTPTVATGGGGQHFYFRYPAGMKIGKPSPWPGVDVIGEGFAVVAVPSIHLSGERYRWEVRPEEAAVAEAPAWLLDALAGEKAGEKAREEREDMVALPASPGAAWPVLSLRAEADPPGLADAPGVGEGQRHAMLCQLVGRALGLGVDVDEVLAQAIAWGERCDPPLPGAEVLRHVRGLAAKHEARSYNNTPLPAPEGTATAEGRKEVTPPLPSEGLTSFLPEGATEAGAEGQGDTSFLPSFPEGNGDQGEGVLLSTLCFLSSLLPLLPIVQVRYWRSR